MRDIRPHRNTGGSQPPPEPPQAHRPQPRLRGQSVPVTAIHVPTAKVPQRTHEMESSPGSARHARLGGREKIIALVFLGLVILAAGLAAFVFLPTANVSLVLRTSPLLVEEELTIQEDGAPNSTSIDGRFFSEEIAISETYHVSGRKTVGEKATGTVDLINKSFDTQSLKEHSRLANADGKIFYITRGVTLPAAQATAPVRVPVAVEAAEAGDEYNGVTGRLDFVALDEAARTFIFAEVSVAPAGGSGEQVAVVTADDISAAREAAAASAQTILAETVQAKIPSHWKLLGDGAHNKVLTFTANGAEGDELQTLDYTAQIQSRVIAYDESAVVEKIQSSLQAHVAAENILFPGPVSYDIVTPAIEDGATEVTIKVRTTHKTVPRVSIPSIRETLAGKSVEDAHAYVGGIPGVRSATIELTPRWLQSIPRIERRITVELLPEQ